MSNEEILNTDILRARIANMEYGKISEEEIRRIYIEETGHEPPGEITVYHSDELKALSEKKRAGKDSGFDGTVIHFYDPKQGINQSYTITRGSESAEDNGEGAPLDWVYNGLGIFTGQVQNQYKDAKYFDKTVTEMINKKVVTDNQKGQKDKEYIQKVELEKYGIGHSLGGNHIQMLQLMNQSFKMAYTINDAAPTAYQLAFNDTDFKFLLSKKFNINPNSNTELYTIPPDKLKAFAEQYYKERGKDIHHLTAEEDMLYDSSSLRGFLDLGDRKIINTDDSYDGIGKIIEKLSDKNVQKLQLFLYELAPSYQEGGMEGLIKELTGVDKEFFDLIDKVKNEWEKLSTEGPEWKKLVMYMPVGGAPFQQQAFQIPVPIPELPIDFLSALQQLGQRILTIKEKMEKFKELIPFLIDLVKQTGITMVTDIIPYLKEIKGHVDNILQSIGDLGKVFIKDLVTLDPPNMTEYVAGIMNVAGIIKTEIDNINEEKENIKKIIKKTVAEIDHSIKAHGVTHVASAIAKKDGKRYEGNDMIQSAVTGNGKKIEVNLSSAVRIYQTGLAKYQEKAAVLNQMREAYSVEYIEDFNNRKGQLLDSIYDMESNPYAYSYLLPSGNVEMVGISVHEDIQPLAASFYETFEDTFYILQEEQRKGIELITKIRTSIEALFGEDQKISALFDLH